MAIAQHKAAPLGHRHPTHDFVAASAAARLALAVTPADVGCDCMQTDTNPPTFWKLVRVTGGVAWVQLGAGGMTDDQALQLADALAKANALGTQTYLVQSLTTDLTNERALEVANGLTIDWSQAGKVVINGPSIPASATPADITALKAPTYIVQTATAALDNERVLSGLAPLSVDYATAGQAIVKATTATALAEGWYPATHFTLVANATWTSAGVADAQKILRLNTFGLVDATCLPLSSSGAANTNSIVFSGATHGTSALLARQDHTHNHGSMPQTTNLGTYHGPADATNYGFMTPAHVTSLAGKADKAWTDNPQAGAYTLAAADIDKLTRMTSATAVNLTVPPVASVTVPLLTPVNVMRYGAGVVTITAGAGVTLLPSNNLRLANQYDSAQLIRITADTWVVKGEVSV